ncbi:hypothetical protein [Salinibacter grassmerensis]|uniref:hypothetical protein n=1 Tax=Salinibacter grassmerensis TaxID=3040353 RepID=UPI0021E7D4CE|nr:hypothetical protein [Salinibacter grassmerensis]
MFYNEATFRGEVSKGSCFYIDADTNRGWPHQSDTTLCKFGVTSKDPSVRCRENEEALHRRWHIAEAELEVVFVATGQITAAEKEIADHTLPWLPEGFQKNAEWRHCSPRGLARIATLIAEDRHR